MPSLQWDNLNNIQMGRYAEYYAKMEFASYGYEIYTSEVDDHGIDFVTKKGKDLFYEVQVKSLRESNKGNYIYMEKNKFDIKNQRLLLCFVYLCNKKLPLVYIIPATAWKNSNDNDAFSCSDSRYNLNYSKKNRKSMEVYLINNYNL